MKEEKIIREKEKITLKKLKELGLEEPYFYVVDQSLINNLSSLTFSPYNIIIAYDTALTPKEILLATDEKIDQGITKDLIEYDKYSNLNLYYLIYILKSLREDTLKNSDVQKRIQEFLDFLKTFKFNKLILKTYKQSRNILFKFLFSNRVDFSLSTILNYTLSLAINNFPQSLLLAVPLILRKYGLKVENLDVYFEFENIIFSLIDEKVAEDLKDAILLLINEKGKIEKVIFNNFETTNELIIEKMEKFRKKIKFREIKVLSNKLPDVEEYNFVIKVLFTSNNLNSYYQLFKNHPLGAFLHYLSLIKNLQLKEIKPQKAYEMLNEPTLYNPKDVLTISEYFTFQNIFLRSINYFLNLQKDNKDYPLFLRNLKFINEIAIEYIKLVNKLINPTSDYIIARFEQEYITFIFGKGKAHEHIFSLLRNVADEYSVVDKYKSVKIHRDRISALLNQDKRLYNFFTSLFEETRTFTYTSKVFQQNKGVDLLLENYRFLTNSFNEKLATLFNFKSGIELLKIFDYIEEGVTEDFTLSLINQFLEVINRKPQLLVNLPFLRKEYAVNRVFSLFNESILSKNFKDYLDFIYTKDYLINTLQLNYRIVGRQNIQVERKEKTIDDLQLEDLLE